MQNHGVSTRLYWDSNLGLGRSSNAAFVCVKYICIVSMVTRCNKFIRSVRTFLLCLCLENRSSFQDPLIQETAAGNPQAVPFPNARIISWWEQCWQLLSEVVSQC